MAWPANVDYLEAIQNPHVSLNDEELRGGQVVCTSQGLPIPWSGNFADVYKIHCPATGNTWAVKCFTREVPHLQERYQSITEHLQRARLPFTVDFRYLEQGIRIATTWYPVLKMCWVEGLKLDEFVKEHLERPGNLEMLLDLWVKLVARLREAHMAHADLQHGNVILVPQSDGSLALRLIDYDGMYVPALADAGSGELGHSAYQHPQRLRDRIYNGEVDRFSHLVIYTSIRCLSVGRRESWQQFNNGDDLLFCNTDFAAPGQSPVFRTFWKSEDRNVRALVGRLALACGQRLEQVPWLDRVVDGENAVLLTPSEEKEVTSLLGTPVQTSAAAQPRTQATIQPAAAVFPTLRSGPSPPIPAVSGKAQIKPDDAYAYNSRGNACFGKGDLDTAIADYTEAIRIKPDDARVYCNRGEAHAKKGDLDKAIADFTKAIQFDPENGSAYSQRGSYNDRKGEKRKAEADLAEAKRLGYS